MAKPVKKMVDIAKEVGVSIMTVHRAIHNEPGISPETKNKILQIIAQSNYRPNAFARAIRRGKFNSIGLATEQASLEMATLVGIFRILNKKGMCMAFAELPIPGESSLHAPLPKLFQENMVDGVILHASIEENFPLKTWLQSSHLPYVTIMSSALQNAIQPDFDQFFPSLLERLAQHSYEIILYLGPTRAPLYHHAHFPYITQKIIATDIDIPFHQWKEELSQFLTQDAKIAVLTFPDEARLTFALAQKLNKRIPEELAILYLGTRRIQTDEGIPLSGWVYSNYELGERAAQLILDRIDKNGEDVLSIKIPFKSVIGATLPRSFFGEDYL